MSTEEGRALAEEWGCAFVEISAKHDENISMAFSRLLAEIHRDEAGESVGTRHGCGFPLTSLCAVCCCCCSRPDSGSVTGTTSTSISSIWAEPVLQMSEKQQASMASILSVLSFLTCLYGLAGIGFGVSIGLETSASNGTG